MEFYQKRYHNFPLKHVEHLTYRFINAEDVLSAALTDGITKDQNESNSNTLLQNTKDLRDIKNINSLK